MIIMENKSIIKNSKLSKIKSEKIINYKINKLNNKILKVKKIHKIYKSHKFRHYNKKDTNNKINQMDFKKINLLKDYSNFWNNKNIASINNKQIIYFNHKIIRNT